jgi:hypothetical protein
VLKPVVPSLPFIAPSRNGVGGPSPEAPVDQLVLNYAAFQFDEEAKKPNGAHHVLRQVKELAAEQKDSRVAIFVQGYERSTDGLWQVARYLVQGGKSATSPRRLEAIAFCTVRESGMKRRK